MLWVRRLTIVLAVIVAVLVAYAYTLPDASRVERRIVIDRPAATVFAQLNDFRRFQLWSPWADIAPDVTTVEYDGPRRGLGSVMRWQSESPEVGSGRQEITVSEPNERLVTALVFDEFGENTAGFELQPTDAGTEVTWWLTQEHGMNPAARFIGSLMDGMVGPFYERGLERLKTLTESLPATDFADLAVSEVAVPEALWVVRSAEAAPTAAGISTALGAAYLDVLTAIAETDGITRDGRPVRIDRGLVGGRARFDAAIPVTGSGSIASGQARLTASYAGPALKVDHYGAYTGLSGAHDALRAYAAALGYSPSGDLWEVYVGEPGEVPDEELLTELYLPIAPADAGGG